MSVFHRANNATIHNGVFNAVYNAGVNSTIPPNDIISVLLYHSATAGLLDAAERFDAPKCDEGTRMSMLLGMKKFVQQGGPTSVFWLHGPAGVGKSALAQSLGLLLKDEGDHAASFFFSRTAPGRNDGNQLIVTLACQLALSIPLLKPLIAKAMKANPLIFNATNLIKTQTLIVDPLNQLHKRSRWHPQLLWAQRIEKRKLHPRLILIDGLDECKDPLVQRDILLCIGHAIRHLSLPFRFIIASRPESHILATFQLDRAFQGPDGVKVVTSDLWDDEDADEQITTFLLKEFAEIRRTHPIREFLPQPWPLPGQIAQLVSKSSKGFIYPATVIRYIKMVYNRPNECLDRILGLSEIPTTHKPYEPLDALYRYIFESVPDVNKEAVRDIFHFLVVPNNVEGFVITPRVIEKYYAFKRGHVRHVLHDLLCIVTITANNYPIQVLHASLPDFLTDPLRSGSLCIETGDAHAAISVTLYENPKHSLSSSMNIFRQIIYPLVHSNITERLFNVLTDLGFVDKYQEMCEELSNVSRWETFSSRMSLALQDNFRCHTCFIVFLVALTVKNVPTLLVDNHIDGLETYILQNYPLAVLLHAIEDEIITQLVQPLQKCTELESKFIVALFETFCGTPQPTRLGLRILKLHMLMMMPYYSEITKHQKVSDSVVALVHPLVVYPQLAYTLLRCLGKTPSIYSVYLSDCLDAYAIDLINVSLVRSGYYKPLHDYLDGLVTTRLPTLIPGTDPFGRYYCKIKPAIEQYLDRVRLQDQLTTPYARRTDP